VEDIVRSLPITDCYPEAMSANRHASPVSIAVVVFGALACASPAPDPSPTGPLKGGGVAVAAATPAESLAPVDFTARVEPILRARCMPCHFEGGKMYAGLPFDQPATIDMLGENLFTRIRDPEEQETIRAFLERAGAEMQDEPDGTPP
jgi:hypothetical protein